MKVLFVNGPNMNMLGIREPDIYGKRDYRALCEYIEEFSGDSLYEIYQSNHEGDIVDKIQSVYGKVDGIVINPAAYTHTSVAIADALSSVGIPYVEVHLSDVNNREDFRKISFTRANAVCVVSGLGFAGYKKAFDILSEHRGK